MSPHNDRDRNFLFGGQGRRRQRSSSWAFRPESGGTTRSRESGQAQSGSRSSPHHAAHPQRSFDRLAFVVKQCPWMLGSVISPLTSDPLPEFYPLVPRSLQHDVAVSFVVTDHTRPEQPQFVISCPLEHVDSIQQMLAPTGSGKTLAVRGTSGHPRQGNQLRSMLLDGTPNIELSLQNSGRAYHYSTARRSGDDRGTDNEDDNGDQGAGAGVGAGEKGTGPFDLPHSEHGHEIPGPGVMGLAAFPHVPYIPAAYMPALPSGWAGGHQQSHGSSQVRYGVPGNMDTSTPTAQKGGAAW